jgi:hypothetical protein
MLSAGEWNGFASALEISAKIIRDNLGDDATARRLITEKLQNMDHRDTRTVKENVYLRNMEEGYKVVLAGLYSVAQRGEPA